MKTIWYEGSLLTVGEFARILVDKLTNKSKEEQYNFICLALERFQNVPVHQGGNP